MFEDIKLNLAGMSREELEKAFEEVVKNSIEFIDLHILSIDNMSKNKELTAKEEKILYAAKITAGLFINSISPILVNLEPKNKKTESFCRFIVKQYELEKDRIRQAKGIPDYIPSWKM